MISALSLCSMKQGWEIKKLGEVCEIINGFAFKSQLFKDCGDDILRISNIQNGVIDDSEIAHFSKEDYPKINFEKYAVLPDDIVVALSGATTGKFGINNTGRKLYLNQRVAICREKTSKLHHLFLLYFLQTQSKSFLESAAGVAQPNLSTEQMKQYDIPIPPLPEQEKIVSELDCLSGIIEKKRQQLKELDALAQSIFYEMFGNPVENERGWEVKKLGEVCVIERGGSPRPISDYLTNSENGVNWIKIGDAVEGSRFINHTEEKIKPEGVKKSRMVYKGDFILSNSMSFGKPYILGLDGCIHDGWLVIRDSNGLFNKNYLYYYLSSNDLYCEFKKLAVGGVVNNLNSKIVRDVNVSIPPLAIQHEFASQIESIDKQKALIKQSIAEAETLLASRMQYYFEEG